MLERYHAGVSTQKNKKDHVSRWVEIAPTIYEKSVDGFFVNS